MKRIFILAATALAFYAALMPARPADAQPTTSGLTGVIKDAQSAVVPGVTVTAVHMPSATTYEGVSQADGRFFIPGMRIGGPYTVTAELTGFRTETQNNITLTLGVIQDLSFTLTLATIAENVTVVGVTSPIFASTRTGATTAVSRDDLATLPTVTGRINDITRLAPQAGASGTFSGQDNRMNNITIDGAYFNNAFGLGGQPGDRTNVSPVSLEAVEQVQVNVAPFDVRQGNFVGAGVNMVTRSGTNRLVASVYSRYRNQDMVGTEINGQPFSPGTFKTTDTGFFVGGPIVKNRLFAFASFENQNDSRPLSTYRANTGGETVTGSVTRVLASDLNALSAYLLNNFQYETGDYDLLEKRTPAKPFSIKTDLNLNKSNKVNFRYSRLRSSTDSNPSGSNTAGAGRSVNSSNWMTYRSSTYSILENFDSGIGELNSVIGSNMSNTVTVGYTTNDESRGAVDIFPFVDILDGAGQAYLSFGTEPNTPNNALLYHTFQAQDAFTRFGNRHSLTFGGAIEKYHSDNVFFSRSNSVYVYNTLNDFYTDANGFLANPNRTVSPVTLNRFQVQYPNLVGATDPPVQAIDAWYVSAYAQDQWRVRDNLTLTGGIRVDTNIFGDTAFPNPQVDALSFLDSNLQPVRYSSGTLPKPSPLWSPRLGFNWDVMSNQRTQLRGGTGVFTGKPAYVWISNQIGNTGVLTGQEAQTNTTARPFHRDGTHYWVPGNGTPASSFELDVTTEDFKFPQTWRNNVAVDQMLPWGMIGTVEFLYNKDLNGISYINANLPAPNSAATGIDNRPRWTGTACTVAGASTCVSRIYNANPQLTAAYVLGNQSVGRSWVASANLSKTFAAGFSFKTAYSYGESKNTVDAGSTASGTVNGIATSTNLNQSQVAFSNNSPGHRYFLNASYSKQYFNLGATTVSVFFEAKTYTTSFFGTNVSYVFSGDANGDGVSNNDLIYVPANTSEMNFLPIAATSTAPAYTADQQAAAFEAYIQQDPYLSTRRGQYAERNGLFMPIVKRMDFSVSQDLFRSVRGHRHAGQIRLDIQNFGNLLNHSWGVGQKTLVPTTTGNVVPLLTQAFDAATNRINYRMALVNGALPTTTFTDNSSLFEVYQIMVSFRYNFN